MWINLSIIPFSLWGQKLQAIHNVEKEKIIIYWRCDLTNKAIMTKQHEKKCFSPYESEQWKGYWSSKEKLQHVDMKHLTENCNIGDIDELQ